MPQRDAPELSDIVCESCGYVLNGLPETGNCPECGTPIAFSTSESIRTLPDWERDANRSRSFRRAIGTRFYRGLLIHSDTRRSRRFAVVCLMVVSLANTVTILAHYAAFSVLSAQPRWLPPLPILAIALPPIVLLLAWGTLELIAYLTAAEGRYWGLRLPRGAVRRVLHYLSVHVVIASLVVMFVPLTFLVLMWTDSWFGLYMVHYLFALSGFVVLAAYYLFKVYFAAMKSIMFASRVSERAPSDSPDTAYTT